MQTILKPSRRDVALSVVFWIVPVLISLGASNIFALDFALAPVADAFVTAGPTGNLGTNNYGGAGALSVSAANLAKGEFQSLMRFDMASAKTNFDAQFGAEGWGVTAVTLRLTAATPNNPIFNTSAAGNFSIRLLRNNTWQEGTGAPNAPTADGVTFASLPSLVGTNDDSLGTFSFNGATSGNFTYDLALSTGLKEGITSGANTSLRLLAGDTVVSLVANSRNFGTVSMRPVLTITAVPQTSLQVQLTGANTVTLFWPTSTMSFTLQENASFNTASWVDVTNVAAVVGTQYQTTIPRATSDRFFRLKSTGN